MTFLNHIAKQFIFICYYFQKCEKFQVKLNNLFLLLFLRIRIPYQHIQAEDIHNPIFPKCCCLTITTECNKIQLFTIPFQSDRQSQVGWTDYRSVAECCSTLSTLVELLQSIFRTWAANSIRHVCQKYLCSGLRFQFQIMTMRC